MSSIRLSEKHGVNPSLEQCFYCLKDKGVILFGKLKGDVEAPRRTCLNREPCDECRGWMEKGIILISVDENLSPDPANPYRTGGWSVITEEAVRRMIQPGETLDGICRTRVAFLPDGVWNALGLPPIG